MTAESARAISRTTMFLPMAAPDAVRFRGETSISTPATAPPCTRGRASTRGYRTTYWALAAFSGFGASSSSIGRKIESYL